MEKHKIVKITKCKFNRKFMFLGQISGEFVFFQSGLVSTAELTCECIGYISYNENS